MLKRFQINVGLYFSVLQIVKNKVNQRTLKTASYLKEVTLSLSGKGAGVKLSAFVLSVLSDHPQGTRPVMTFAAGGFGKGGIITLRAPV